MRESIFLECTQCGNRYYRTTKNGKLQKKLEIKKFCNKCSAHVLHKEKKK